MSSNVQNNVRGYNGVSKLQDGHCLNNNLPGMQSLEPKNVECSGQLIEELSDNIDHQDTISSFFDDSHILVTGGTGFVGKALLEKLLRSCPGIETIYILVREKRGQTTEQRFKELIKNPVFDKIRSRWPTRLQKLVPLGGDVSAPNLGLDDYSQELVKNVTLVFHSAATVRFTEPLDTAVKLNVLGTERLLSLCLTMTHIKAIVYISTAYSNAPKSEIGEQVYPAPFDPDTMIKCAQTLPPETMNMISEKLQGEHPNTYTLTKAMSETIVQKYSRELPICIVRPSIVTAAVSEPSPGWIDNVSGVTGIIMEISRGTYRSGYCKGSLIMDIVPVDIVVNTCITAAWHSTRHRSERCPVYNCISGQMNPISWERFTQLAVHWARLNPSKFLMWYPNFGFTESRLVNVFWENVAHLLPAFLYDLMLRACSQKPIMVKIARRFQMAAATGEYFANRQWCFETCRLQKLCAATAAAPDGKEFATDITALSWESYMETYIKGIRKYILKDSDDSLPAARRKLKRLYWAYRAFQTLSGYLLFKMVVGRR